MDLLTQSGRLVGVNFSYFLAEARVAADMSTARVDHLDVIGLVSQEEAGAGFVLVKPRAKCVVRRMS